MKKPPFQVASSDCRFDRRQAEDTHHRQKDKDLRILDDRPERALPFHAPHGYHTEEDFAEWIDEEMKGERP